MAAMELPTKIVTSKTHLDALRELPPSISRSTDLLSKLMFSTDASLYRRVPSAVIRPKDFGEVASVLRCASNHGIGTTFRTAGTSLSGQSVTHNWLIDLNPHWQNLKILEDGMKISAQPAVIGARINRELKQFNRKIGPDPASISVAKFGGILANNSSGMCCGVKDNAYHTLSTMLGLLADGTQFHCGFEDSDSHLRAVAPTIWDGLGKIRQRIFESQDLVNLIRHKHQWKNTTGISLNAFVDFKNPSDILGHLMIGSEGTLGFIGEATLKTIPSARFEAVCLYIFKNPVSACKLVSKIREFGASAIEFMDGRALQSVSRQLMSAGLKSCQINAESTGLLISLANESEMDLLQNIEFATDFLSREDFIGSIPFRLSESDRHAIWSARKGLLPAAGGERNPGSIVIIEDVLFPPEDLVRGYNLLRNCLQSHRYEEAIVFGHAKDGNLHFVLRPNLANESERNQYRRFMDALVSVIVDQCNGALKAEHGTGTNMAPFVKREWGENAWSIMKEVKSLLDPNNILNPNVIFGDNDEIHLQDIKTLPAIDPLIDKCMECGFCEAICPSSELSLSPRQRIVIERQLIAGGKEKFGRQDAANFEYAIENTCAGDGLCQTMCPVEINTGDYIKSKRARHLVAVDKLVSKFGIFWWKLFELGCVATISVILRFPRATLDSVSDFVRKVFGVRLPKLPLSTGRFQISPRSLPTGSPKYFMFTCCMTRMVNNTEIAQANHLLNTAASNAGKNIIWTNNFAGHCCGQAFASKGLEHTAKIATFRLDQELKRVSKDLNAHPVFDNPSCFSYFQKNAPSTNNLNNTLEIAGSNEGPTDPLTVMEDLLSGDKPQPLRIEARIIPSCSHYRTGDEKRVWAIGKKCAVRHQLPKYPFCCGSAGDRGLIYPELPESACKKLAFDDLGSDLPVHYYSASNTCHLSLSQSLGVKVEPIGKLLAEFLENHVSNQ